MKITYLETFDDEEIFNKRRNYKPVADLLDSFIRSNSKAIKLEFKLKNEFDDISYDYVSLESASNSYKRAARNLKYKNRLNFYMIAPNVLYIVKKDMEDK